MKSNEELTIKEAKALIAQASELSAMLGLPAQKTASQQQQSHSFTEGQSVFIRCVTHHYIGRVVRVTDSDVVLENASWVAEGMRFHNMLRDGFEEEAEIEPYPNGAVIARGAIVDWCVWNHELPTKQQ